MKYTIPFIILVLTSCASREEKQAASDAIAGCQGAVLILHRALQAPTYAEAMAGIQAALGVVEKTVPRIENAVSTPVVELPRPVMDPPAIAADPAKYTALTPPSPKPGGWGASIIAGLVFGGGALAFAAKQLLPLVPGIGPPAKALLGVAADSLYALVAHKDQTAADAAAYAVAASATKASEVLALVKDLPAGTLPVEIEERLKDPTVAAALAALSSKGA
jgi:hypothetical protein